MPNQTCTKNNKYYDQDCSFYIQKNPIDWFNLKYFLKALCLKHTKKNGKENKYLFKVKHPALNLTRESGNPAKYREQLQYQKIILTIIYNALLRTTDKKYTDSSK